jgi:hypothetical protein
MVPMIHSNDDDDAMVVDQQYMVEVRQLVLACRINN